MSNTQFTHDTIPGDVDAVLARLRRCDGREFDAAVIVWEQCQALAAEVDRLRRIEKLQAAVSEMIAAQDDLAVRKSREPGVYQPDAFDRLCRAMKAVREIAEARP